MLITIIRHRIHMCWKIKSNLDSERLNYKIKEIEQYLGSRCKYNSDYEGVPEVWLLEYLHILKIKYYKILKRKTLFAKFIFFQRN